MSSLTQKDFVHLHLLAQADQDFVRENPLSLEYKDLQYPISKHYDIFDLIGKGLGSKKE